MSCACTPVYVRAHIHHATGDVAICFPPAVLPVAVPNSPGPGARQVFYTVVGWSVKHSLDSFHKCSGFQSNTFTRPAFYSDRLRGRINRTSYNFPVTLWCKQLYFSIILFVILNVSLEYCLIFYVVSIRDIPRLCDKKASGEIER